jgi:hypothetical protein
MHDEQRSIIGRRGFLGSAVALGAAAIGRKSIAAERPPVAHPRATSGDAVEPDWAQRLTITVGPKQADLVGDTETVLQAAIDYVARLGGGTVEILPGTYRLRNAVYLASKVRLLGHGTETTLVKEPSISTRLADDSDWFDQEITLVDAAGFRLGDGVCIRAKNTNNGANVILKRTLVARDGNRFKLDRALRENIWLAGESTCATLFPLLSGDQISDVTIENLALDGNKEQNEELNGNYAGCIFAQDCNRITVRNVTARNYRGDGISWQICHDVQIENCHIHDNLTLGLHPGSGSQRPVIRNNRLERNQIGIFFCWGVKYGLAEKNIVRDAGHYGVSIGHHDTENLVCDNEIVGSGKAGVIFRPERGQGFAPHRNRLESNRIIDSGPADGIAVDVQGQAEAVSIVGNEIRETRGSEKRVGIRLGSETRDIRLDANRIEGFAEAIRR